SGANGVGAWCLVASYCSGARPHRLRPAHRSPHRCERPSPLRGALDHRSESPSPHRAERGAPLAAESNTVRTVVVKVGRLTTTRSVEKAIGGWKGGGVVEGEAHTVHPLARTVTASLLRGSRILFDAA